jgi:protein phosphatase
MANEQIKQWSGNAPVGRATSGDAATQRLDGDSRYVLVNTAGESHIGTRSYQQDALFVTEAVSMRPGEKTKAFGIVCDGMGGLENGEKASNMAVMMLREALDAIRAENDVETVLTDAVHQIDAAVCRECAAESGAGSGTTLAAALVFGRNLHWISVGDSRIYILRNGEILQITQDHVYMARLMEMVEAGQMSVEEAEAHPQKGALISYIGSGNVQRVNTNKEAFPLVHKDIVLLCSDGLPKSLTDGMICEAVYEHFGDIREAARQLPLRAFDAGGGAKDNTSVVLMQYLE